MKGWKIHVLTFVFIVYCGLLVFCEGNERQDTRECCEEITTYYEQEIKGLKKKNCQLKEELKVKEDEIKLFKVKVAIYEQKEKKVTERMKKATQQGEKYLECFEDFPKNKLRKQLLFDGYTASEVNYAISKLF